MKKEFKFNGDWETELYLEEFGKTIDIWIHDQYGSYSPDPKKEQLKTIDFLLDKDNQIELINSIIDYLETDIYPYYQKHEETFKEAPNRYPEIKSKEDFINYFRLQFIEIFPNIKDDFAYYTLKFDAVKLESEHGIAIDMHKARCVEHGPGEGTNTEKICEELNITEHLGNKINQLINKEKPIIHKPHPKYNKLLPWQVDANRRFPINAYRELEDKEVIEAFKKEGLDLKSNKWLYQYAKRDNRQILIEYFEN